MEQHNSIDGRLLIEDQVTRVSIALPQQWYQAVVEKVLGKLVDYVPLTDNILPVIGSQAHLIDDFVRMAPLAIPFAYLAKDKIKAAAGHFSHRMAYIRHAVASPVIALLKGNQAKESYTVPQSKLSDLP